MIRRSEAIMRTDQLRRRAVTMAEAIASTMIVGIMMVASLEAMQTVVGTWESTDAQSRSRTFAHELLDEILHQPYEEPKSAEDQEISASNDPDEAAMNQMPAPDAQTATFGRESNESGMDRAEFDDVDDYDGWSESELESKDGQTIPDTAGWGRSVAVSYADPVTLSSAGAVTDTGLKLVSVSVTDPSGRVTTVRALCSRYGPSNLRPPVQKTIVAWMSVGLNLGTEPEEEVFSPVYPVNQPAAN